MIKYSIPVDGMVTLNIYNTLGEKVDKPYSTIQNGNYEAIYFKLASGVYTT
ncbi:hypothetical protein MASR2M39_25440 [Ignavibacteriales bacterium]